MVQIIIVVAIFVIVTDILYYAAITAVTVSITMMTKSSEIAYMDTIEKIVAIISMIFSGTITVVVIRFL